MTVASKNINSLNAQFYNTIADNFARPREKPWQGWVQLLTYFNNNIAVADLGCGDGRFYEFLKNNGIECKYTGYDISASLIDKAKARFPSLEFFMRDVTEEDLTTNYDVVCAFGLIHHIENLNIIESLLNKVARHLNNQGYLIITIWKFNPDKEKIFNHKARELNIELKENDYLLDWGGSGNNIRFCHLYSTDEIYQLKSTLSTLGFELIEEYTADKSNLYLVFKKIN